MKHLKEFTKRYIAGFITGLFIFGTIGVYAAAVFPSNQTTYDNKTTGMQATEVQDALDELYTTCFPPTTADQIIEGLEKDPYECRYFFTGANPNNYITFNNETWRIISAECDGTIKIMKDEGMNREPWNFSGIPDWEVSTLNDYLNEDYYDSLTSAAQAQIVSANYSIGAITNDNNDLADQINDENGETWYGKIALPTVSEYIRSNSNPSSCGTFSLNSENPTTCKNTTWMSNGTTWWTLTRGRNYYVYTVYRDGSLSYSTADYGSGINSYEFHPTIYISSDLTLSGSGTQSDPYTIE